MSHFHFHTSHLEPFHNEDDNSSTNSSPMHRPYPAPQLPVGEALIPLKRKRPRKQAHPHRSLATIEEDYTLGHPPPFLTIQDALPGFEHLHVHNEEQSLSDTDHTDVEQDDSHVLSPRHGSTKKHKRSPRYSKGLHSLLKPRHTGTSNFDALGNRKQCFSCDRLETPYWRDGWSDPANNIYVVLCNACGIRFKKHKVFCERCHYVPKKEEYNKGVCPQCDGNF